jgi:hypothetical protein
MVEAAWAQTILGLGGREAPLNQAKSAAVLQSRELQSGADQVAAI